MKIVVGLVFCLLTAANSFAQEHRTKLYNLGDDSLAIQGYDPVAYFLEGKAKEGNSKHATIYRGVRYHFASEKHRKVFLETPERYEPQYGGWCAYAMGATGEKVTVDPGTFKIIDGRLFLFYNRFFNNTLKSWNKDEMNLHTKADKNWSKIIH